MAQHETRALVRRNVYNELADEHNRLMKIATGPGLFYNLSPAGLALWLDPKLLEGSFVMLGQVLSSEATFEYDTDLPVQWRYTVQPVTFAGESLQIEAKDGYSGEFVADINNPDPAYAYNLMEYKNSRLSASDTILGCGIDIERLKSTFPNQKPQPAPQGTIIMMINYDGFWWFTYENAIDGDCS